MLQNAERSITDSTAFYEWKPSLRCIRRIYLKHCSEAGDVLGCPGACIAAVGWRRPPLSERYGLALTAFAARRLYVRHRPGCRAENSKALIFQP